MKFYKDNRLSFDIIKEILLDNKYLYIKYVIFTALSSVIAIGLPYIANLETNQLAYKYDNIIGIVYDSTFNIFIFILLINLIINLIDNAFSGFKKWFESQYSEIIGNKLQLLFYKKLENINLGFFLNNRNKSILMHLRYSLNLDKIIDYFIKDMFYQFIVFAGIFGIFAYLNIWIGVVIFVSVIISFFLNRFSQRIDYKYNLKKQFDENYFRSYNYIKQFEDSFSNLYVSGGYKYFISQFDKSLKRQLEDVKSNNKIKYLLSISMFLLNNFSDILIKLIVGFSIFYGTKDIGFMTMSLMYSTKMKDFFGFLFNLKNILVDMSEQIKMSNLYLTMTKDDATSVEVLDDINYLDVKNLYFGYPRVSKYELDLYNIMAEKYKSYGGDKDRITQQMYLINQAQEESKLPEIKILKGVSLSFKKGNIYGIVGKNGAGKTTIINLLMGFYNNYEGNIYIDGREIKNFTKESIIGNIGIITQEPYLIEGLTIRENLMLGVDKNYSDEEIIVLLKDFGLYKTISNFVKGLDAEVGNLVNFSGGQKQLLVLIRIILQDKKILILDEGTNQLDAENEILVMKKLLQYKHDKIIVFITHRMTTMQRADMIYCIEDGIVTDSGNHNYLLERDSVYKRFWNSQVIIEE